MRGICWVFDMLISEKCTGPMFSITPCLSLIGQILFFIFFKYVDVAIVLYLFVVIIMIIIIYYCYLLLLFTVIVIIAMLKFPISKNNILTCFVIIVCRTFFDS